VICCFVKRIRRFLFDCFCCFLLVFVVGVVSLLDGERVDVDVSGEGVVVVVGKW